MTGAIGHRLPARATAGLCLALRWRDRGDDITRSSVGGCSRKDVIADGSVLHAAVSRRGDQRPP